MRDDTTDGAVLERRRHRRFQEDTRVLFVEENGAGDFFAGELKDLSIDGMRLRTGFAFPPGCRLYLGIFLPDIQEPLVTFGAVLHCEREKDHLALGVQFLSVSAEQRRAIGRLADYLRERHGESAAGADRETEALVRQVRDEAWWQ